MPYVDYQMGKYYGVHAADRPRSHVRRAQDKYETAHRTYTEHEPLEGAGDGDFGEVVADLATEEARLRRQWPNTGIYPTREAVVIYQATLRIFGEALEQANRLLSQPAIYAFSASRNAVALVSNELATAQARYVAAVKEPTTEAPSGDPLKAAQRTGAERVRVPRLRSATLRAMRDVKSAYEGLAHVKNAVPYPAITNAILNGIIKINAAVTAVYRWIERVWGSVDDLPGKLRAAEEGFSKAIKYGTIGGVGLMLFWALKPGGR